MAHLVLSCRIPSFLACHTDSPSKGSLKQVLVGPLTRADNQWDPLDWQNSNLLRISAQDSKSSKFKNRSLIYYQYAIYALYLGANTAGL